MNRHNIRYMIEHKILPHWFFEKKQLFIELMIRNKDILYEIVNNIFMKEEVKNPYTPDMFGVSLFKVIEQVQVLKISFPEPEEEPLCYCAYLFFDEQYEKTSYFCIEKGNSAGNMLPFVCSWSADGSHQNYGHCSFEDRENFLRCAEIYRGTGGQR